VQTICEFRRKAIDPHSIVLTCSVATARISPPEFFFKISNNIERSMNKKKMKNKKYRNVKIFSSDIIKIFKEYFQNKQTDRQTDITVIYYFIYIHRVSLKNVCLGFLATNIVKMC